MSRRKNIKNFVDEAKRVMEENLPLARFNETLRNIEKLRLDYAKVSHENSQMREELEEYGYLVSSLTNEILRLRDQVSLLEEVFNSLHIIVSIKDVKRRNFLWYNENYSRILGYRHKQLQELNSREAINLYHPEDYDKIKERNRFMTEGKHNRHSCHIRLRRTDGRWIRMRSDYIALKRAGDGSLLQAIEIFSDIKEDNS
ncbi:MAG: PAS domain-containing protein [Bacteroidales bacterium]|nr:PAS domain-containing protein [Bacteroidales bacterium]